MKAFPKPFSCLLTGLALLAPAMSAPAETSEKPYELAERLPVIVPLFPEPELQFQHQPVSDIIGFREFQALSPLHRNMLTDVYESYQGQGDGPMMCFTPGYPDKAVSAFQSAIWGTGTDKFRPDGRWTFTATDGSVTQGTPLTLTYSFVPDGTIIPSFDSGPQAASDLDSFMTGIYGSTQAWQAVIGNAIEQWDTFSGLDFVLEPNDDGVELISQPGALGVRGDIRISGRFIDGESGSNILAFNFFPNNGDMVIDTANPAFYGDLSQNSLNLRNVITHENGHGLGFSHVCPVDESKLMEPFISRNFDGPQLDDILAVQRNYGDPSEPNDTTLSATSLGNIGSGMALSIDTVSTDDDSDVDFYSFSIGGPGVVSINLTPSGSSYLEGVQNSNGSCTAGSLFDSSSVSDLTLSLLDTNGLNQISLSNSSAAGGNESINAVLDSAGTYFVGVSPDSTNSIQLYGLDLSFVPGMDFPQADLGVVISDDVASLSPGDPVNYTVNVNNDGPEAADGTTLTVNFPNELVGPTWSATYDGGATGPSNGSGNINEVFTTLPSGSSALFRVNGAVAGGANNTGVSVAASLSLPSSLVDTNLGNNTSIVTSPLSGSGLPNVVEEFTSFTGITSGGQTSPGDFGGTYGEFFSVTETGFRVDSFVSQNGRGLTYSGNENGSIISQPDFPLVQDTHMMAFWFRAGNNSFNTATQLINVAPVGGNSFNLMYMVELGVGINDGNGLYITVPTTGGNLGSFDEFVVQPNTWNSFVIQFTPGTTDTSLDGGMRVWINPTSGNQQPNYLNILPSEGQFSSSEGSGPAGNFSFGASIFNSSNGPEVFIDSIGVWDGFGTPGVNDLQAALDFLGNINTPVTAEVDLSVAGQGIPDGSTIDLGVFESGSTATREFVVRNIGQSDLLVTDLSVPSGFTIIKGLESTIESDGTGTFILELDTSTDGMIGGQVSITNSDGDENPFDFNVTATVGDAVDPQKDLWMLR